MKNLILLFALLLSGQQFSYAKCIGSGIYLFSQHTTLNKNGLIIVEFHGSSQSLIPDLNKKYPIYLQSGKLKNTLLPVEILKGEFQVTQVVFKPSTLPEKGSYTLQINGLPSHEKSLQVLTAKGFGKAVFTFNDQVDPAFPQLLAGPVYKKSTMVEYGCGPAKWVYFSLSAKDDTEVFVKASVKNNTTGKTTHYLLSIENGMVGIGHGMCSGGFHFEGPGDYTVSFKLYDLSGNSTNVPGSFIFKAPATVTAEE